jgi:flagellar M-ring protein FliF
VEGLGPESVSVVDMSGNLLSRPRRDAVGDGTQITEATLEYRQAIEHDLVVKISSTLDPLLGPDKFRTGVSADIDMSSGEQSEETFDPSKSVMLSSQKIEDSSGTTRYQFPHSARHRRQSAASASRRHRNARPQPRRLPLHRPESPAAATTGRGRAPAATSAREAPPPSRSENITYQSSRITKHMKLPLGTVKRLSIAVLVDQGSNGRSRGAGASVVTPRPRQNEEPFKRWWEPWWAWIPPAAIN